MNKKGETKQVKTTILGRFNEVIGSLNKVSLLFIIILYSVVIGVIFSLIPTPIVYSHPYIPDYEHLNYNDDVGTLLKIVHQYTANDNDEVDTSIGLNTILNTFPGRTTKSRIFMPKALLEDNKMHFFTQYENYEEVNHHMFVPSNPQTIFIAMDYYDKDGIRKYYSFKEDIFTLTKKDLNSYQDSYDNTNISISINPKMREDDIRFDVRFELKDNTSTGQMYYHVDVQTWAVSKSQEIYPFIGFYNYTNVDKNTMHDSGKTLPLELNIEYIYVKVKYYNSTDKFVNNINKQQEILYKLPISP